MAKQAVKIATPKKKISKSKRTQHKRFAVLKVSHLPKHFEEKQLKKYFSQFGPVHGVFVARSKKTLKPKDLALILVAKEVAPIIATTIHNVLNFNRIMKCEVVTDYDPSVFRKTVRKVTTVSQEKRRVAKAAVQSASKDKPSAARRRSTSIKNKSEALKKLMPNFILKTADTV